MIGYLRVDGAAGEAKDQNHPDWIKLVSLSHTITRPVASTAGSHRASDRATLGDLVCVKELDASSPKLFEFACQGKAIPKIEVDITTSVGEGGEKTLMRITLTDTIISNTSLSGQFGGNHHPTESVSFNFAKIEWKYTKYNSLGASGGDVASNWDVQKNAKA